MSSEPITQREYWNEVQELAEEALSEHPDDEEARQEWIWETVDGHQWVIYTAYNYEVLSHSDNDAYSAENFGAESVVQDGTLNTAALAFGALCGDVMDRLSRMEDDES